MTDLDASAHAVAKALAALDSTVGSNAFASRQTLPAATLSLAVDGFGNLRLPVAPTRAKALARFATPAPFGHGGKTLIDPRVRDVGEVKSTKIRFDRRAWTRELKPLLEKMRVELGLPQGRLTAKLDKLLVYGPGQFFKSHQDTERDDDMIGTLVVVLPSQHKGGSLVVRHQGETRRFQVRNPADPLLRLFAFYATCEHEVRPVTEGYRVVLSHELRFKSTAKRQATKIDPATSDALKSYFDPAREPSRPYGPRAEKLVYLLDHQYSQRSLAWKRLKGVDQNRAEALRVAAESLGLQVYLALINVKETWSASVDEPRYYRGRGSRYSGYYDEVFEDDDYDGEDDSESTGRSLVARTKYELEELIDCGAMLDHWRDSTDQRVSLPQLQASDVELCWLSSLENFAPENEEYEGYMGNYGNTLEREYRRAAVVLWPARHHYRILARAGGESGGAAALEALLDDADGLDTMTLEQAVDSLLDVWPGWHRVNDAKLLDKALKLSSQFDDAEIIIELLRSFSLASLKPARLPALLSLGKRHGAEFCQQLFAHWSGVHPPQRRPGSRASALPSERRIGRGFDREEDRHRLEWLSTFPVFCRRVNSAGDEAWRSLPQSLFDTLHALMIVTHGKHHALASRKAQCEYVTAEVSELKALVDSAREISGNRIEQVIESLDSHLEHYASDVPVALIEHLADTSLSARGTSRLEVLRTRTLALVKQRAEDATRVDGDWRIEAKPGCGCDDCRVLARFLRSREMAIGLPLAKARRRHLHGQIEMLEIPVSHSTRRQGRPYVLELRKRHSMFAEAERERSRELSLFRRLGRGINR